MGQADTLHRTARAEWQTIALAGAIGTIGSFLFMVLPLVTAALGQTGAFSSAEVGAIGSAPLFGMFFGSLVSAKALAHVSARRAVQWGAACLAGAYLASIAAIDTFLPLVMIQFLGGTSGTVLLSVAFSLLGRTALPDRSFGIFIAVQMLAGAIGTLALETVLAEFGLAGAFKALACLSIVPAGLGFFLHGRSIETTSTGTARIDRRQGAIVLLAQAAFGAGIMLIWSVLAQIGAAQGWSSSFVARILSLSLMTGIAGAVLASLLGRSFPRWRVLVFGTCLVLPATFMAALAPSQIAYVLGIGAFTFIWNLLPPFQLGIVSDIDRSGRLLVLSIAAVKLGYAVGTASGGLLGGDHAPALLAFLAVIAFVLSCFLLLLVARITAREAGGQRTKHSEYWAC